LPPTPTDRGARANGDDGTLAGGLKRATMKIVVEFYRTRERDDAHALVGRETYEAIDLDAAINMARTLSLTLDMPQRPDSMSVADMDGNKLHSGKLHPDNSEDPDNSKDKVTP
jgi:hypothetical protein